MKKILFLFPAILFLLSVQSAAQGRVAVPFVLYHPSPDLNAMGGAFTAMPTTDAFGFFFNPAQLGNFGRQKNFSVHFYPSKAEFLPSFDVSDLLFNSAAFSAGYNLARILPQIPVSIGAGYMNTKLEYGQNVWTDEHGNPLKTYTPWERYRIYAVGIGIDYYVRLNLGYSKKIIESDLAPLIEPTARADAEDFGLQITAPLADLLLQAEKLNKAFLPFFDLSLGYTLANVGGYITYYGSYGSNPLPRTAKLGYAVSFGFSVQNARNIIKIFRFNWSSEARDLLVENYADGTSAYIKSPGRINIWDNVLQGKTSEEVNIVQGWRISFAETFDYSQGKLRGPDFREENRTYGFTIGTTGLLKWLDRLYRSKTLEYIHNHFELSYSQMHYVYDGIKLFDRFDGVALSVYGF